MARTLAPSQMGTGHKKRVTPLHPRDAYRDVPILQRPTWDNGIAGYFYLGGISSGSYVLGTLTELFGNEEQRKLSPIAHAVSFATMLACPPLLIEDLGKPSRFHHMLRIFKPASPMNLGSWTLTLHGGFATLLVLHQLAKVDKLPYAGPLLRGLPTRALSAGGIPTALTLGGYTGVLLGTTSVPVWSTSPLLGGLFMASALATGTAATRLVSAVVTKETGPEALPGVMTLMIGGAELALLGGYLATSKQSRRTLLRGREGKLLLGAVVASLLGLLLDAIGLRTWSERRLWRGTAAAMTLLSGACLRWAIVRAGHVSAADREETLAATQPTPEAPGWGLHRNNG
jgi:formate-dependent nitrite reductase membrane component NrfD